MRFKPSTVVPDDDFPVCDRRLTWPEEKTVAGEIARSASPQATSGYRPLWQGPNSAGRRFGDSLVCRRGLFTRTNRKLGYIGRGLTKVKVEVLEKK